VVIERAGKTDFRKLIQEADEAMYQAKGKGKNTYHITLK
jgi:PleD family two-component response regulator